MGRLEDPEATGGCAGCTVYVWWNSASALSPDFSCMHHHITGPPPLLLSQLSLLVTGTVMGSVFIFRCLWMYLLGSNHCSSDPRGSLLVQLSSTLWVGASGGIAEWAAAFALPTLPYLLGTGQIKTHFECSSRFSV